MLSKCPICENSNKKILDFGGYRHNKKLYDLVECSYCGFMFLDPKPTQELLESLYNNPEYFSNDYSGGKEVTYEDSFEQNKERYQEVIKKIKKYKKDGSLLEVGCAGGHFLKFARDCGYQVKGVEVSKDMANFAKNEFELDVFAGIVEEAKFSSQSFDIIYLGDVLEHVYNLNLFMEEMFRILKPSGLLYVDLPGTFNYTLLGIILYPLVALKSILKEKSPFLRKNFILRQHRKKYNDYRPYHIYEFRPKSIKKLLKNHNFSPISIVSFDGYPKRKSYQTIRSKMFCFLKKATYFSTRIFNFIGLGDRITAIALKNK